MNKQELINKIEAKAKRDSISTKYIDYKKAKMEQLSILWIAINMRDEILLNLYEKLKILYPDFMKHNELSKKELLKEAPNRLWVLMRTQEIEC